MSRETPHLRLVESEDEFHQNVWRYNESIVVHKHTLLPDKCIICNQEADGITVRKMVFWHNPVLLPVLLLSWPFYVLFALVFRRTLTINMPLCKRHLWQRRLTTAVGVSLVPIAFWMAYVAIAFSQPTLILSGIVSVIVGAVLVGWGRNPVWATHIREEHALLRGAHPSMRDDLPEWNGEPW